MLAHIMLNILPCPTASTPSEHAFSAAGITADKCRSCLDADRFEELQIMKYMWHSQVKDVLTLNYNMVEEVNVDEYQEFQELLKADAFSNDFDVDIQVDDVVHFITPFYYATST